MASNENNQSLSFWAERAVALLAIGAILYACLWIAKPLLFVLAWGALIAIALAPLHRTLARVGGNRQKTAATVIVLVLLALVIFPLSYLPGSFKNATDVLAGVTNNWTELKLPPLPSWASGVPWLGPIIDQKWTTAASNSRELVLAVKPYVGPTLQWLAARGGSFGLAILEILLSIILAGVFMATAESTTSLSHKIANRLGGTAADNLLDVAVRTVRGVAQGVIGTALIQGFLSGLGFLIAGVPFAIALGVLCFGTAMLQIGTWLVWIPVAIWLSYQGETGWALFTTVLGIIINVLDNVLKPLLIGHGAGIPLWVIFIGPLVMAAGYSIVMSWLSDDDRSRRVRTQK
jgi:predicted PurR-regulated permease PerM